jgi:hypothetical protein
VRIGTKIIFAWLGRKYTGAVCTDQEVYEDHELQTRPAVPNEHIAVRLDAFLYGSPIHCWHCPLSQISTTPIEARIEGNELILDDT